MVPGFRPLVYISYKYNPNKVLSFIVIEKTGSTEEVLNYLSKYPGQFSNVVILPFARPLVMYKFFVSVNEF